MLVSPLVEYSNYIPTPQLTPWIANDGDGYVCSMSCCKFTLVL